MKMVALTPYWPAARHSRSSGKHSCGPEACVLPATKAAVGSPSDHDEAKEKDFLQGLLHVQVCASCKTDGCVAVAQEKQQALPRHRRQRQLAPQTATKKTSTDDRQ